MPLLFVYVVAVTTFKKDKEFGQDSFAINNTRCEDPARLLARGRVYARVPWLYAPWSSPPTMISPVQDQGLCGLQKVQLIGGL